MMGLIKLSDMMFADAAASPTTASPTAASPTADHEEVACHPVRTFFMRLHFQEKFFG